jgi:glutamyl-tRNA reductase
VDQDVQTSSVALIGYGEVGKILTRALRERGVAKVAAYDILLDDPKRSGEMKKTAGHDSVTLADSPRALLADARLVISAARGRSHGCRGGIRSVHGHRHRRPAAMGRRPRGGGDVR